MKKIIKFGIAVFIVMIIGSIAVFAQDGIKYPWIYESFENEEISNIISDGAGISLSDDGAFGSGGSMKVEISSNITNGGGGFRIKTNIKNGESYKLSFYISLEKDANIPRTGSKDGSYKEDGTPSKLYAILHDNLGKMQTIEIDNFEWKNDGFIYCEKEFIYEGNDEEAELSIRVGERKDYGGRKLQGGKTLTLYFDDIKLIPKGECAAVSNLNYSYVENESNVMRFSYDFAGEDDRSLCVFMIEHDGEWMAYKILGTGAGTYTFDIPSIAGENNCKIVVYPADFFNGSEARELLLEDLQQNVTENLSIYEDEICADVNLLYNDAKDILVIVCQYNDENEMISLNFETVSCAGGETATVQIKAKQNENTSVARLYIWEGKDFKSSNMNSLVNEIYIKLN